MEARLIYVEQKHIGALPFLMGFFDEPFFA
jgi:hypothetical protein